MSIAEKVAIALVVGIYVGLLAYVFMDVLQYLKGLCCDIANSWNKRQRQDNSHEEDNG